MAVEPAVLVIITIVIVSLIAFYQKKTNGKCVSKKQLNGKTVVITGGTSGIGLEAAKDFARRGARVIIACPFENEGNEAKKEIIKESNNNNVVFKLLDLASLKSTRDFAADILENEGRLDILVNNAGVGIPGDFQTPDGMHFIMQVNYYGSFLLTLLLLPLLKKTGTSSEPSRIVNTASLTYLYGVADVENLNRTQYWYTLKIYCNSKHCLVLFSRKLSAKLKGTNVVTNCVDPGLVGTNIYKTAGSFLGSIAILICRNIFKTPVQGAQTILHASLDEEAGTVSGMLFKDCKVTSYIKAVFDEERSHKLWRESMRLVRLKHDEIDFS